MRSLIVTPAALLALAAGPAQILPILPITSSEAVATITRQLHKQVQVRLRASYRGESQCTGYDVEGQELTPATQLASWRCKVELRGARFPMPCKAEAIAYATSQPQHVTVRWLMQSRYCHEARPPAAR